MDGKGGMGRDGTERTDRHKMGRTVASVCMRVRACVFAFVHVHVSCQARGSFHTAYVKPDAQGRPNLHDVHGPSEFGAAQEVSRLLQGISPEGRVHGSRMDEQRGSSLQGVRAKTPGPWHPVSLHSVSPLVR